MVSGANCGFQMLPSESPDFLQVEGFCSLFLSSSFLTVSILKLELRNKRNRHPQVHPSRTALLGFPFLFDLVQLLIFRCV